MERVRWQWRSPSPDATYRLGVLIGQALQPGQVVALNGPLGVGKTCLAQGVLAGLGVEDGGRSPTFTLLHPYQGRLEVVHVDVYRLDDVSALRWLGWDDFMERGAVALVEWADRAEALLPEERLTIDMAFVGGDAPQARLIMLTGVGAAAVRVVTTVRDALLKDGIEHDG